MEIFFMFLLWMTSIVVWYKIVMYCAKHYVGKDVEFWKIFTCLIIAGPIGWIILVIIFITDQLDRFDKRT